MLASVITSFPQAVNHGGKQPEARSEEPSSSLPPERALQTPVFAHQLDMQEREIGADPAEESPDLGATHEPEEQSAAEVDERQVLRPVAEVAEEVDLSAVRIRHLLHDGKIEGELHLDEGYGQGKWYVTSAAVEDYIQTRPSWREIGLRGGRPRASR